MAMLDHPMTFCEGLRIVPDESQEKLLREIHAKPVVDALLDPQKSALRAAGVGALWHMLAHPNSIVTVLSADREQAVYMMGFLRHVLATSELAEICRGESWSQLMVGHRREWQLRVVSPSVCVQTERNERTDFGLIIGAKSTDPAFSEACEALEKALREGNKPLVRLW